ncbi:hypothetical protein A5682_17055 [Mycobacterium mantenii]|nr:hypothetical protein A5682_17055 [Mycobacterium mantenii]
MRPDLTGFSRGSNRRVVGVWVVFVLAFASWLVGGYIGAAVAVVAGIALIFVRWWGQPAWSWAVLWRRGRRPIEWTVPVTVANNRSGGGGAPTTGGGPAGGGNAGVAGIGRGIGRIPWGAAPMIELTIVPWASQSDRPSSPMM